MKSSSICQSRGESGLGTCQGGTSQWTQPRCGIRKQISPGRDGQQVSWNACEAKPANTINGNYTYQHTDLSILTRGLPLEFTRSYNSAMPQDSPLGFGWTQNYNITVTENISDSTVLMVYGDGR